VQREASSIVTAHAQRAVAEMRSAYPVRNYGRLSNRGRLVRGLRIDTRSDFAATSVIVRNGAPHAYLFEHGTATRHTASGISRGAARPGKVFIPIAVRQKTAMVAALMQLIERQGFSVNRPMAA
jgi:Bacteriophage HK97-gp10, putative tail-component